MSDGANDDCSWNRWCDLQYGHPEPCRHIHDQRFDGDDPYLVCHRCGTRWDALTGILIGTDKSASRG